MNNHTNGIGNGITNGITNGIINDLPNVVAHLRDLQDDINILVRNFSRSTGSELAEAATATLDEVRETLNQYILPGTSLSTFNGLSSGSYKKSKRKTRKYNRIY